MKDNNWFDDHLEVIGLDDKANKIIKDKIIGYCLNCDSTLGIDCGDAEPDYNDQYCSEGCASSSLCLVAVSGDCSEHGMGDTNDILHFHKKHNSLIVKFLQAQLNWHIKSHLYDSHSRSCQKAIKKYYEACDALMDVGIFEHKYHTRTEWKLTKLSAAH